MEHNVDRNDRLAARLHWALLPYGHRWKYRNDAPIYKWWWHLAWLLMKAVERLPGSDLYPPLPPVDCRCDYCLGLTDVWTS